MKFTDLLDFILPQRCLGCGEEKGYLCSICREDLEFIEVQCCPFCRKKNGGGDFCNKKCAKNFSFNQLLVCLQYAKRSLISKMIVQFKYRFSEELAQILGKIMKHQLANFSHLLRSGSDGRILLVPVPLSTERLKYRGFNQALLLAEYLAKNFSGMELCDCLSRRDGAERQAGKTRDERLKNLENRFFYKEKFCGILEDCKVILVDDIATTCTTLGECAKVLKANGAEHICGLVLARGK